MPFQMSAIRRSEWAGFLFGGIVGAIAFILIWGVAPLNPFDVGWMATPYGSDPSFAGIGSLRFIKEPWSFPLGVIHGLVYPNRTSIVFVDGIPFVALLAKLVATFVHRDFQYFGLWGLACTILQGGLGSVILQKSCKDSIVSSIGAIFFLLSPFFLGKMFGHVSMAGQWVLLLALLLIRSRNSEYVRRNEILLWALVSLTSIGVIVYFTPMVLLLMVLYYWLCIENDGIRSFYRFIISFSVTVISCLIMFWLLGGLLPDTNVSMNDYGIAPYNLNELINSEGQSRLIRPLPLTASNGGEGFSWLGLGVVVGGLYLLVEYALKSPIVGSGLFRRALPYGAISAVFLAYAATNVVMFGDILVAKYPLPPSLLSFFSMFRTSARFIWPVWYLTVILIVGGLSNRVVPKWRREIVLMLLVSLQIFDSFPFFLHLNKTGQQDHTPPLSSPFWARMDGIRHLIFAPAIAGGKVGQEAWGYIEYQAVRQDITTNTFWLGRYPMKPVQASIQEKIDDLKKGELGDGDLFIVNLPSLLSQIDFSGKLAAYLVDNQFIVGRSGLSIPGNGVANIEIQHARLADYLKHLETLGPDSLIIVTARSNQNPVVLDDATRDEMKKLNIANALDNAKNFNFVSVFGGDAHKFYQKIDTTQVSYSMKKGDLIDGLPIKNDFDILVSNSYGNFPHISIGGKDFSENYIGMNICVYDLKSDKVVEAGTFDLYAMTDGVYVKF